MCGWGEGKHREGWKMLAGCPSSACGADEERYGHFEWDHSDEALAVGRRSNTRRIVKGLWCSYHPK